MTEGHNRSRAQTLRQLAAKCRTVAAMKNISPEAARAMLEMAADYEALAEIERQLRGGGDPVNEIS